LTGYTASDWSGDCTAGGSVTIEAGVDKTCYITNSDIQPLLTVTKVVNNNYGGTLGAGDFTLYVDTTEVVSGEQNGYDVGTYTVSEDTPPTGYEFVSITGDCDPDTGEVTLAVGDVKSCTITNQDIQPKLTVI
jgi:hypothetical protein